MPIDDFSTRSFTLRIYPPVDGKPWVREKKERPKPASLMRGTRKQYDMATINGQDTAAQVGQGAIVDRAREHLGHSDRGVIQVRKLWQQTIEANLRGEEPPNLIRDAAKNRLVHIDVIEKLVKAGEMTDHVPRFVYVER
jgi:5,5'-dehydrodivanillate O-demethylase